MRTNENWNIRVKSEYGTRTQSWENVATRATSCRNPSGLPGTKSLKSAHHAAQKREDARNIFARARNPLKHSKLVSGTQHHFSQVCLSLKYWWVILINETPIPVLFVSLCSFVLSNAGWLPVSWVFCVCSKCSYLFSLSLCVYVLPGFSGSFISFTVGSLLVYTI